MAKKKKKKKTNPPTDLRSAVREWVLNRNGRFTLRQISHELRMQKTDRPKALEYLRELISEEVITEKQGKYRPKGQYDPQYSVAQGQISMSREGYGFVKVNGEEEDIFIAARKLKGALHGDTVQIVYTLNKERKNKRTEGEVEEIIERSKRPYVGILQKLQQRAYVITEHRNMPYDIKVPPHELYDAESGQKVAVLVIDWDAKGREPIGRIVDVLGDPGNNNAEMHAILAEFGLPYKFDDAVEREAETIPVEIPKTEIKKRRDFRGICTFTVDPADAKDFDDALSFRRIKKGLYEIGVHIADVTHYVQPGMLVEKEAAQRATSVYLVDRTISMLPEKLSNNLCSLRPNEDKLCFSAVFEITDDAVIKKQWFGRTVIRSTQRFNYEEVQTIIETGTGTLSDEILTVHKIAQTLRQERCDNGSVLFERAEAKVEVDANGKPLRVYFKEQKESNNLIEEFMLLANRSVAALIGDTKNPKTFVYRCHAEPTDEKMQQLRQFIKHFGYTLKSMKTPVETARELNKLLKQVEGKPEGDIITAMALRCMARATYSTNNIGHFGLAFTFYTHFTSPIRRYPDMMVHRLLAKYLEKGDSENKAVYEDKCKYSSAREQAASDAERASIKYKMVEFMMDKEGMEFDGIITGVTEWGFYVELNENHIEGLVAARSLRDDFYQFDESRYALVGQHRGRKYQFGDAVRIRVKRANLEQKQLDFVLVGAGRAEDAA